MKQRLVLFFVLLALAVCASGVFAQEKAVAKEQELAAPAPAAAKDGTPEPKGDAHQAAAESKKEAPSKPDAAGVPSIQAVPLQAQAPDPNGLQRAGAIQPEMKKQSGAEPQLPPRILSPGSDRWAGVDRRPREKKLIRASGWDGDVRTLPQNPPKRYEKPIKQKVQLAPKLLPGPSSPETSLQGTAIIPELNAPAPATTQNFDGLDFANWGAGWPPDTVGDVGPDHFIQAVNTSVGIYNKTGTQLAAFTFDDLMEQGNFGNPCDDENRGDPIVLYDTFEDRWIITDFAFEESGGAIINSYECFAVSKTSNPVSGGWWFYSVEAETAFADYPKLGVWPDGIYMSANLFEFSIASPFVGTQVWAFNKHQAYAGYDEVQVVTFDGPSDDFTLMPSNARLQTGTPPSGRPNLFISTASFLNALGVYKFSVNWDNVGLSTFTGPDTPLTGSSWPNEAVANAPSSGGSALDTLSIRAMMQNQYTNIGGAESLWITHTVNRASGGIAAPRFYEVNVTGGTVASPTLQGATYDPDAANTMYRFMPSLAVDRAGNMALGYNTSSSSTKPAIKYAGQLATDSANSLSLTEQTLIQGAGTQTNTTRWGDYSTMTLDPDDGCTFWFTGEYYSADGSNWKTRIGAFKFSTCTALGAGGTVTGTVTNASGGAAISGVTVALGSRTTTTNGSGVYTFSSLPAGTYPELTASITGFTSSTQTSIVVTDGGTTTKNFSLSAASQSGCFTDTTQTDFGAGTSTGCDLSGSPGDIKLTSSASINQQNTTVTTSGFALNSTQWISQTFQPTATGQVTQVDLNLFCSGCSGTTPNLTVSIRAASGGVPTGADLATATITGFSSGSGGFFSANFGTPATVTSGQNYAVIVRASSNPSAGTYAFVCSCTNGSTTVDSNPYANGSWGFSTNSGGSWTADSTAGGRDMGFKIYLLSGYNSPGVYTSGVKDANPTTTAKWTTISYTTTKPANTDVKFQVAASTSEGGPFDFVGPDGTTGTFFSSGASLSQFDGKRYLKYQATLSTTSSSVTPTLHDVSVCFNNSSTTATSMAVTAASGTYGGTVNLTATLTASAVGVSGKTVSFTLNGSSVGSATTNASGVATVSNVSLGTLTATTHNGIIGASFAGDGTHGASSGTGNLTISKKALTVDADDKSKTYGDADPTNTATITGFVNSETVSVVSGSPSFSTTGTAGVTRPFGTYTITPALGTLTATNYSFTTFTTGTLTVNKKALTVDADDKSKTYGDADPTNTATITGFVNSETTSVLSGSPSFSTTGTAGTARPFGTYTITPAAGTLAATNYSFSFTTGTLTVNKKALTVDADDKSKTYGDADPTNTATITGFVNSETVAVVSGSPSFSTSGTAGVTRPFGTYTITPAAGTLAATNYSFTFTTGTLTVNKKALTVDADDKSKTYGDADPTNTATITGFVNSETTAVLTGSPSFSTSGTAGVTRPFGTYTITPAAGTLAATNYSFTFTTGTLAVNKKALTVDADDKSKTYGDADPTNTATITGFVNSETTAVLSGSPSFSTNGTAGTARPFGTYTITPAAGTLSATNYSFTFTTGTLTVNKKDLTVDADDKSKTYGDADPTATATITGFVNGETSAVLTGSPTLTISGATTGTARPFGTYTITPTVGTLASTNYNFTFTTGTLTVNKKGLTVTADNQSKTYGDADPTNTATITGFVNSETAAVLSGAPSFSTTGTAGVTRPFGTYTITPALGTLVATNYSFSFANGTLTVNKKALTITAENKTKTYGAANPTLTATFTGFVNSETSAVLDTPVNLATTATASSDAGAYTITASGAADNNYSITHVNGTLTINQAPLTITADNKSKLFGEPNPTLTATYTGFVLGQTESVLDTPVNLSTTATTGSAAGTYPITATGAADINYNITHVNGTLTIAAALLTVTANNLSKTYGAADPTPTVSYSGFINGDDEGDLTGSPAFTISGATSGTGRPAGSYTVTPAQGTLFNANYAFTFVAGNLTVNKASLTVTADNKSKTYGAADPTNTATISGFANSETVAVVSGAPSFSTTGTAGTGRNAGSYTITPALGSLTATNYNFTTFNTGTLTVNQAPLTITADDKVKAFGAANPTLTASYTGFVLGQNESVLDTPVNLSTTATTGSAVGTYPITASGAADVNYNITHVNGTLTITSAVLTVTAQNKSKTYGDADPTPTVTYSGFINGDDEGDLTGAPVLTISGATPGTGRPAGSYTITVTQGTLANANYGFSLVNGTLTVNQAALTVTTNNKSRVYGTANPSFDGFISGIVNSDNITATYGTAATMSSDAGTYPITATLSDPDSRLGNYSVTNAGGTLTINKADSSISVDPATTTFGANFNVVATALSATTGTPAGTVTFFRGATNVGTQTLNGSGVATLSVTGGSVNAGSHTYTATYNGGTNFNGSDSAGASVTINKATPTATLVSNANPVSEGVNSSFTVTMTGTGGTPTGTVEFFNDTTSLGTSTLSGGSATRTALLAFGTHDVHAVYSGDTNFLTANSNHVSQVVEESTTPVITSISPVHATEDGAQFTLTVNGSNFVNGATVRFDGDSMNTTYVSANQLTAVIPAGSISSAGQATVVVRNPDTQTSNALIFAIDTENDATPEIVVNGDITVTAGQSGSVTVTVTPPDSGTLPALTAECLNLPANATCAYNDTTKTVTITTAAGTPVGTYTVTVVFTPVQSTSLPAKLAPWLVLPMFGVVLLGFPKRNRRRAALMLTTAIVLLALFTACGTGRSDDDDDNGGEEPVAEDFQASVEVQLTVQ